MRTKRKINNDDLSLKLFIVLSRATKVVSDRIEEDMRSHGLNPSEFQVLEILYHLGEQPIQQLGKKVLLASGSMTYVVDKLEQKDLVERKACPSDRRVIYAKITEKGDALMSVIFPKHQEAIQRIFSILEDDEKALMIEKLKKLGLYVRDL